jgi:uncharacterized protein YndB with AHSA1/START domain
MLKRFLFSTGLLLTALFIFLQARSSAYRIERSVTMAAPAADVYRFLEDMHQWPRWSPWDSLDPQVKRSYGGAERGKGASFFWDGNPQVGKGRLVITEAKPHAHLRYAVRFEVPLAAEMTYDFELAPAPSGTKLTWVLLGEHPFWAKLFALFVDLDKQLGGDMQRGLTDLKGLVEARGASAREPSTQKR